MHDENLGRLSRRLRNLVEPLAANVYFAPEAISAYEELGLGYGSGYFCSRSACMGKLSGEAVAAVFGVFKPSLVVAAVTKGWRLTTPDQILEARLRGATASLRRILDGVPDGAARATELLRAGAAPAPTAGHPIFGGLLSLGFPGDPIGDLWRAADLLREHRGDSHNAAWVAAGVDAVEINLLTEHWWGIPARSYVFTRGWDHDEVEAADLRLRERGLVDDDGLTDAGMQLREEIEATTDRGERAVMAAIGDDIDELLNLLEPWATAIVAAGGYPADPSRLAAT